MSPITDAPVPQLVATPREQYLMKEETRIRDLASPQRTSDPQIALHYNAMLMAEDLMDRHEIAAEANRRRNAPHIAIQHDRYAQQAKQLRLYHLSQLAHLLI